MRQAKTVMKLRGGCPGRLVSPPKYVLLQQAPPLGVLDGGVAGTR